MIALTQNETAFLRSIPVVALIQEAHRRGLTVHTSAKPLLNEDRRQLAQAERFAAPEVFAPVHSSCLTEGTQHGRS